MGEGVLSRAAAPAVRRRGTHARRRRRAAAWWGLARGNRRGRRNPGLLYNAEAIRQSISGARPGPRGRFPTGSLRRQGQLLSCGAQGAPATLGAGCDIVSVGELRRALSAGFAPEHVVFSGVGKHRRRAGGGHAPRGSARSTSNRLEELDVLASHRAARVGEPGAGRHPGQSRRDRRHPSLHPEPAMAAAKFGIPADQVLEAARRIAAASASSTWSASPCTWEVRCSIRRPSCRAASSWPSSSARFEAQGIDSLRVDRPRRRARASGTMTERPSTPTRPGGRDRAGLGAARTRRSTSSRAAIWWAAPACSSPRCCTGSTPAARTSSWSTPA